MIEAAFKFLKEVPSWFVLSVILLVLFILYEIRPDATTEDSVKAVLGALLLSLRSTQPPPPPPPKGDSAPVVKVEEMLL